MFIFIDLDDTILDFKKAESVALKKALKKFDIEATDEVVSLYSAINDKMWKKLEKGENTRAEITVMRFSELLETLKIKGDAVKVNETYKHYLGIGHFYMPEAEEFLKKLKGHRLFIVSNGTTSVQKGRIKSAGLEKYFENIFFSEDIGFDKPDKRFFDKVFKEIDGFDKEEAIIIGDSLSSDILGGKNAGIKTCWYNPKHKEGNADYIISSLMEFFSLGIL